MKKITCYCEKTFEADIPDKVDFDQNPGSMTAILEGEFMSVSCPQCGKVLKPEYPFSLTGSTEGIDFFFIPELDRSAYFFKKLEYKTGSPKRIVIGYRELVEKIKIYKEELDDRIIEVIKYYLLQKAMDTVKDKDAEIDIYFHEKTENGLVFHIEGMKSDEIAVTTIQNDMYDKIGGDIDKKAATEPFKSFLEPPYVSIKKVYIDNE
jgi:hypothetical protein